MGLNLVTNASVTVFPGSPLRLSNVLSKAPVVVGEVVQSYVSPVT